MARQTIVVGVDPSEQTRHAIRFALAEAVRRDARVVGVSSFRPPENWVEGYEISIRPSLDEETRNVETQVRRMFREVADELGERALAVPVDAQAIVGPPADALLRRSRDADLLVIGHRGRGALASAVLGSVGLQCVLHASCPVTVVPPVRAAQQAGQDR